MKSKITGPGMPPRYDIRARSSIVLFVVSCLFFVISDATSQVPVRINNQQLLVKKVYTAQIGIREKGYNSGLQVERYLRYVHLPKGNPWCAAFVCWVFGQAGVVNPRTGWSPSLIPANKTIWVRGERGKVKKERIEPGTKSQPAWPVGRESRLASGLTGTYPPRPITDYRLLITDSTPTQTPLTNPPTPNTGDIFGLFFPEKNRIAHVGFIDHWDGTWMISVEGNTNVSGSREGDGVYRKRRLVKSIYKVARYIHL